MITRDSKHDVYFKVTSFIIFISSILTLFFLFSVNQRGFDITDEGFHLLASQFPLEVKVWPNVAHVYTALMFQWSGENIVKLRMLSESLLFGSVLFLFLGLNHIVSVIYPLPTKNVAVKAIAASVICLGGLFYYVHFDTTPSYNSINATALYLAAGCLCFTLARQRFSILFSFLAGIFIGVLLLVKFPTAVAFLVLSVIVMLSWPPIRWSSALLYSVMMILGTIAWIAFHVFFLQSWSSLSSTLYLGINTFLSAGYGSHSPLDRLQYYALDTFNLVLNAFLAFWKIYVVLIIGALVSYRAGMPATSVRFGRWLVALIIWATLSSVLLGFYKGGTTNSIGLMDVYLSWIMLLLTAVVISLMYAAKLKQINLRFKQSFVLFIFLFMLPFAGAVGTANVLTLNLTQYMAAWFALILLLLLILSFQHNNRWIFLSGAFFISVFASCQIISAGFIDPYSLYTPIQQQTVSTTIGSPATTLKLDKATSEFFNKLTQMAKLHGVKPRNDILAFSNMPGLVFALGGKSPVVPFYPSYASAKGSNGWLLEKTTVDRIKNAFILQNPGGVDSMPDLARFGIKFPADYIFCGEIVWPLTGEWVRLWKPKKMAS